MFVIIKDSYLQGSKMLVLGRTKDESIVIDGNIEIRVCDILKMGGNKTVKLGITAPKSISVHRKEIQDVINRENRQAVPSSIG